MRRLGPGRPEPLGVTAVGDGINAAVFSAHADAVDLCVFDAEGAIELERIRLPERTGDVFHGQVAGLGVGTRYGLRVTGPYDPPAGHRFNPAKLLVDPYALAIDRPFLLHPSMFGFRPGRDGPDDVDSAPAMPKAVVAAPTLTTPWAEAPAWASTSIYELHIKGFSARHPGVPIELRGTWAALASPACIDHLTRLGLSTIEVMPAAAWIDERHLGPLGLTNAWGYNPVTMMAPDPRLAAGGWEEVASTVAALNAAGIEVLLDVVFNHSGEGDEFGPTVSFRGLDNATYYRLDPANQAGYINDAGCGNILAADRPAVVRLVLDALRAWAGFGGLNGFRFDLMSTLGRRPGGFDNAAPIIAAIEQDPLLRDLKLIAEPWDIGPGGYQVGAFGGAWGEWNDHFRDDMRRFWRGDGTPAGLATRLAGSSDLFWAKRRPSRSINFITAHDGFTLADLVSFEHKHNEANGEHNRDGTDTNWSWNHGVEGPSQDAAVLAARRRDQINLIATVLLSRGTPMLGPGTELGQTQEGNNNAYSQDAMLRLDWERPDLDLTETVRAIIDLRNRHPAFHDDRFLTGRPHQEGTSGLPDAAWTLPDGRELGTDDWSRSSVRALVATFCVPVPERSDDRVAIGLNADWTDVDMVLPAGRDGWRWTAVFDTASEDPARPADVDTTSRRRVAARSLVILVEEEAAGSSARPAASSQDAVDRLAAAVGIAPEWHEISGARHRVSVETKRALLNAMGLPASGAGEIADSLARVGERELRVLPDRSLGWAEQPVSVRVVADKPPGGVTLRLEDGREVRIKLGPDQVKRAANVAAVDGRRATAWLVTLPAQPLGRHRLRLDGAPDASTLTIAPPRCYLPPAIRGGERLYGVAAHLYTLRRAGDGGLGDFTTLGAFSVGAAQHGATFVGLNPMHAMFSQYRERASPYNPSDRRFLDPIFIDVTAPDIAGEAPGVGAVLARESDRLAVLRGEPLVDYPDVWRIKAAVLEEAFAAFDERSRRRPADADVLDFEAYLAAGGPRLRRFATFEALTEALPGRPWMAWDEGLRHPDAKAVEDFAQRKTTRLRYHGYLQWLAERQFDVAAKRGRDAGLSLGLYRDIAVGTAPDGAEAWSEAGYFARGVSVGSPPDPFSADGQIWSLPPPNPMADTPGETFAHLLQANMRHAGALRIDHAMGLQRLFWVPDGAKGAEGAYVGYSLEANLAELALESQRAKCLVIGEDLGTVPDGFRERIAAADLLSYRVLFFEREGNRFLPPDRYPQIAVACVSTHDLPTLAGWWSGADIAEREALALVKPDDAERSRGERERDKAALLDGLGLPSGDYDKSLAPVLDGVHAFIGETPSVLAVAQIDDLVGETVAVNLPGTNTERPNWRRRLAPDVADIFDSIPSGLPRRDRGPPID